MEKICKECGVNKHFTMYPKDKRHPLGHNGRVCSECRNASKRTKSNPIIKEDKTCFECNTLKPWTGFQRDKKSSDGLRGKCKECYNCSKRNSWNENKEYNRQKRKEYNLNNKDKIAEWKRTSYIRHRDSILDKTKKYAEANRESKSTYSKLHYKENKHIYIANARKREGRLNEGINNEFNDRMKEIYYVSEAVSKETGVVHNVDHIIPLTHPEVCGIHCPWNVQILTQDENQVKKNKFDGTYENESWRSYL